MRDSHQVHMLVVDCVSSVAEYMLRVAGGRVREAEDVSVGVFFPGEIRLRLEGVDSRVCEQDIDASVQEGRESLLLGVGFLVYRCGSFCVVLCGPVGSELLFCSLVELLYQSPG